MKKVKFVKTLATAENVYVPGQIAFFDSQIANELLKSGAVELCHCPETASVTQPEKKIMPQGRPKKAYA